MFRMYNYVKQADGLSLLESKTDDKLNPPSAGVNIGSLPTIKPAPIVAAIPTTTNETTEETSEPTTREASYTGGGGGVAMPTKRPSVPKKKVCCSFLKKHKNTIFGVVGTALIVYFLSKNGKKS